MDRTAEEIAREHSRLQSALKSTSLDKKNARSQIMNNMGKLEKEHVKALKNGGVIKERSHPIIFYMAVSAILVIAISFAVTYVIGLKI